MYKINTLSTAFISDERWMILGLQPEKPLDMWVFSSEGKKGRTKRTLSNGYRLDTDR
jgi:hypothetical protein